MLLEERAQRRQCLARCLDLVLAIEACLLQHLLRSREIAETEDARECVVQLRLLAVERVLELVVREERRIARKLRAPIRAPSDDDGLPSTVSVEPSTPSPSFQTRATSSGCLRPSTANLAATRVCR